MEVCVFIMLVGGFAKAWQAAHARRVPAPPPADPAPAAVLEPERTLA